MKNMDMIECQIDICITKNGRGYFGKIIRGNFLYDEIEYVLRETTINIFPSYLRIDNKHIFVMVSTRGDLNDIKDDIRTLENDFHTLEYYNNSHGVDIFEIHFKKVTFNDDIPIIKEPCVE
jgi:hypothetical protein